VQESIPKFEKKYDQGEKLGEGAHAVVYKCTLKESITQEKQVFAVKIARSDEQEILEAHEKEFDIINQCNHKNVIHGIEKFKDDFRKEVCQVMDFIPGTEIMEHIS
jgi:serine/threonine protein kinase